jgi:hypothetical protein
MKPAPKKSAAPLTWSVFDGFRPLRRQPARRQATWTVFDGFERPRPNVSWTMLDGFMSLGRRFAEEHCRAFPVLLERWSALLRAGRGVARGATSIRGRSGR